MLTKYDPERAPDPRRWLAEDEQMKHELVRRYHRKARIRLPREELHAVIHVIVENQVALGDEIPVAATLERLMREGLDRHEAIHAIGSVLAVHMRKLMKADAPADAGTDPNLPYYEELAVLTPESWRREFAESEDD